MEEYTIKTSIESLFESIYNSEEIYIKSIPQFVVLSTDMIRYPYQATLIGYGPTKKIDLFIQKMESKYPSYDIC